VRPAPRIGWHARDEYIPIPTFRDEKRGEGVLFNLRSIRQSVSEEDVVIILRL